MQSLVLRDEVFSTISVRTLFYPCAGDDWRSVVSLFVPEITQFWFVDICYRPLRQEAASIHIPAGLTPAGHAEIIDVECDDVAGDRYYRGMTPFIRKQQFHHDASGTGVEVNWYMRRGPSALRSLKEPIGISSVRL
ncbi:MAG: hypothetical protein L0228_02415 [Planctomycetes bacterium]|nr:hypothetical protein [Planctomycetota bacterium]